MKQVQSQNEAAFRLLTALYLCAHIDAQPPTAKDLEKLANESMGISQQRFLLALAKLKHLGYVSIIPNGTVLFPKARLSVASEPKENRGRKVLKDVLMLTDLGHKWVDSWYSVDFRGIGIGINFQSKFIKDPPIEEFPNEQTPVEEPVVVHQSLPTVAPDFWAKWGSVAALAALPLSILLWWLS